MASEETKPIEEITKTGEELPEEEHETRAEREARERREEEKRRVSIRRRKLIPPFVMLLAGAIVSIAMRLWRYDMRTMLIVLLCVLLAFYIAGCLIKYMMDHFEKQIEDANAKEGEVIEKELAEDETDGAVKETDEG